MNVVLLGPPGAGKGTQARRLCEAHSLLHLSTGDMLREAIAEGSALGQEVEQVVRSGRLVPDETVSRVVSTRLQRDDAREGVLFDGFPRTVVQAVALDAILAERGLEPPRVVELVVPDAMVLERLARRGACPRHGLRPPGEAGRCSQCGAELAVRPDDDPDVVRERLRVHHALTAPVSAHYASRGTLHRIDGTGSVAAVGQRVAEALEPRSVAK